MNQKFWIVEGKRVNTNELFELSEQYVNRLFDQDRTIVFNGVFNRVLKCLDCTKNRWYHGNTLYRNVLELSKITGTRIINEKI